MSNYSLELGFGQNPIKEGHNHNVTIQTYVDPRHTPIGRDSIVQGFSVMATTMTLPPLFLSVWLKKKSFRTCPSKGAAPKMRPPPDMKRRNGVSGIFNIRSM